MKLTSKLLSIIEDENTIPDPALILKAFSYFKPVDTKIIIIGESPYPKKSDACGLAFSVMHNKFPGSLKNILKELKNDVGVSKPNIGDLRPWAKQGVLLVNTILTTKRGKSLAHANMGWEEIVAQRIQKILSYEKPVVIFAWGKTAQEFVTRLTLNDNVLVLSGSHPSPNNTRKGFFKGFYFSKANTWLREHGVKEINWNL